MQTYVNISVKTIYHISSFNYGIEGTKGIKGW